MGDPAATGSVGFRPMVVEDLSLMRRWLQEPHVRRWWDELETLAEVAAKYQPRIEGEEKVDLFLILLAEAPVGFIQSYLIRDHPEYADVVQVDEDAAGVDLFIGEPGLIGRGLGPRVLRSFLEQIVFARPDVGSCVIGPSVDNAAAIRAYAKAGFEPLKVVAVPGEDEPEQLMVARRPGRVAGGYNRQNI